jgi:hypothetical protein
MVNKSTNNNKENNHSSEFVFKGWNDTIVQFLYK